MYDLQGLIETDVARPEPGHPKYHRWVALSIKVGIWLKEYLESEIYDKLPGDVAYADDIIRAVEALVEGSGSRGSTPTASERSSPAPVSEVVRGPLRAQTQTQPHPKIQPPRNQPQNNIDPREYAAAWRQLPTQTASNGNCLYCDNPGHGTADCPYLSPRVRGNWWKPSAPLWYPDPREHGFSWEQTRIEQSRYTSAGVNVSGASGTTASTTAPTAAGTASATAPAQPGIWITSSIPMTEVFVKLAEPRV